MKNYLFLLLVFSGSFLFAQKLEYNPNRDPILKKEATGLRLVTVDRAVKICLCCNGNSANKPLLILDGKEILNEDFEKLNSQTIESIEVLKDAKATELYGEKGKNGVLLIKSKEKSEKKKFKNSENQPILAI